MRVEQINRSSFSTDQPTVYTPIAKKTANLTTVCGHRRPSTESSTRIRSPANRDGRHTTHPAKRHGHATSPFRSSCLLIGSSHECRASTFSRRQVVVEWVPMGSGTGDGPRSTRDAIDSKCPSPGSGCLSICCLRLWTAQQWPCSRVTRFGDHVVASVPIYRRAPGGGPRPHCSRTNPPNRRERGRHGYGRPRPRLHPLSGGCAYHHILDRCFWWPYRLTRCHWQPAGPLADTVTSDEIGLRASFIYAGACRET